MQSCMHGAALMKTPLIPIAELHRQTLMKLPVQAAIYGHKHWMQGSGYPPGSPSLPSNMILPTKQRTEDLRGWYMGTTLAKLVRKLILYSNERWVFLTARQHTTGFHAVIPTRKLYLASAE